MTPNKTAPFEKSSLQTASLRSFSNLRNDRTITIRCSIRLQQETAIKKQQAMLRTAPNFSNSTNGVSAHRSRHQTSASLGKEWNWAFLTTLTIRPWIKLTKEYPFNAVIDNQTDVINHEEVKFVRLSIFKKTWNQVHSSITFDLCW